MVYSELHERRKKCYKSFQKKMHKLSRFNQKALSIFVKMSLIFLCFRTFCIFVFLWAKTYRFWRGVQPIWKIFRIFLYRYEKYLGFFYTLPMEPITKKIASSFFLCVYVFLNIVSPTTRWVDTMSDDWVEVAVSLLPFIPTTVVRLLTIREEKYHQVIVNPLRL